MADSAFSDLQGFIAYLERQGELRRVSVEVDPELEITEIATRVVREKGPALLFERVKGADFPLAINLFGSERRIELALGRHPGEIGEMLVRLAESLNPPTPRAIWSQRSTLRELLNMRTARVRGRALSQEVSEEPDLDRLPILKCWPQDGGRFLTFPLVLTTHPTTGRRNLGIYRMHVYDRRTTGMHWQIQKGGRFHYWQAEAEGRPIEVAVALGGHPALMLSAAIALPENIDEVAFAGLLSGRPYPLVPARTISMAVPANAEFVLEGVVPPRERRIEGPFGDHFGYYSRQAPFPVFNVRRITRRRNAVYPATVVGKPPQEDKYIGDATQEMVGPLLRLLRPELVSLWAYYEAGFHNLLVAAVRVRYRREAIKSGLALLSESQLALTKCVILVDADVNPRDWDAVLGALRCNFDPERDLTLIPRAPLDTLDFSSFRMHLGSKMIVDATSPVEEDLLEGAVRGCDPPLSGGEGAPSPPESDATLRSLALRGEAAGTACARNVDLGHLDSRILGARLMGGVLLAVRVSSGGREVCERVLQAGIPAGIKIVAVVSQDVDLDDREALLWGIFTRFDPVRDVLFARAELRGVWPVYHGPMGIDATFKEGYPDPLEMPEDVRARVSRRWGQLFP
ncbi:MAG: menaquinone biosynthesis decarboxylase [Sphingomonadaceae bacterium]